MFHKYMPHKGFKVPILLMLHFLQLCPDRGNVMGYKEHVYLNSSAKQLWSGGKMPSACQILSNYLN